MKYISLRICSLMLLLFIGTSMFAQNKEQYKGVVKEVDGTTLPGVTIMIKGTSQGTTTDIEGEFTLSAATGDLLVFSYIGYETTEIKLTANKNVVAILSPQVNFLEETVVVGYGHVKKSDLTSAISSVKASDLIKTSITSVDQGLQGRAAGVVVTNTSGQPGGGTSIRIRGTTSIMGTNEPLYVIDGIPIPVEASSTSSGVSHSPSLNPLASINPGDVESIEVLKDASATAIYGARGANGVVLITTKRGSKGKIKTTFNAYYGLQQVSRTMDMLNAEQLAMLGNEASDNANMDRKLIYADLNNLRKQSTDWQNEIFRIAPIQNYDLGFSGGGEKNVYFLSANYFSQDGIILGSDYKKGNIRFNLDQELSSRVKMGTSLNLSYSNSNGVVTNSESAFASSITSWALEMNPGLPVKRADGSYVYENNTSKPAVGNPVQDANEYQQVNKIGRVLGNIYADVNIIQGLNFKSSFGIDYYTVKDQNFASKDIKRGESSEGSAAVGVSDGYTWLWENTLSYNKTLAEVHSINAVAGMTAQKYAGEYLQVANAGFNDDRLGYYSIQAGEKKQLGNTGYLGWQMISYLARVNYGYDSRYLVTLTGRVDGSSKFGNNYKYGFFPSGALAWRASEEGFFKDVEYLDNLKVRASYGKVGNEGILAYSRQGLLFISEAYIGDNQIIKGQGPYSMSNESLKWETTTQTDLGFDIGLFKNRFSLSADFYIKKTTDLLLGVPLPYDTGYDYVMKNVGDMENKGFELTVTALPVNNKRFSWDSNLTFGLNRNTVTYLAGSVDNLFGSPIAGITNWTKVVEGTPFGTIYGYKTDGIVQQGDDLTKVVNFRGKSATYGDRKYVDKDGSQTLDENDYYVLGDANPDFTYGWNNTFTFKLGPNAGNLNFNLYLQGAQGNEIANFNLFSLESFDGSKNNSTVALDRWTPTNPSNKYPRANANPSSNILSDHQVEDGSYLRVKDITLSYDLPLNWLQGISCNSLQVYVSAKNVYTFTKYSGYDPEVSRFGTSNLSMGADYGSYPMAKLYMIGFKANF